MSKIVIPRKIASDELLVRSIFHSLHVSSKDKLRREAFLPAPGGKEVSVLRLKYTCENGCKNHSLTIKMQNQTYQGLALIRVEMVLSSNNNLFKTSTGQPISVSSIATPLDTN